MRVHFKLTQCYFVCQFYLNFKKRLMVNKPLESLPETEPDSVALGPRESALLTALTHTPSSKLLPPAPSHPHVRLAELVVVKEAKAFSYKREEDRQALSNLYSGSGKVSRRRLGKLPGAGTWPGLRHPPEL